MNAPETTAMPASDASVERDGPVGIDILGFEGFSGFELDLSCLSAPSSPAASTSELPPSSPAPSSTSSRAVSLTSSTNTPNLRQSPTTFSSRLSPVAATAVVRGSWPLIKYVGRGTPIDRSRRIEWGGFGWDDVGEDGLLFSTVRSTSLDSAMRPSQRSVSPEWNYVSPSASGHSPLHRSYSRSHPVAEEPLPETVQIQIDGLGSDHSGEWASFMQTVLGSADSASTSASTSNTPEMIENVEIAAIVEVTPRFIPDPQAEINPPTEVTMTYEEIRQLDTGIDINLGSDAALDLGLRVRGGMNWLDLVAPASGRDSPSVYSSQASTPRGTPTPSMGASENRSNASTKTEANGGAVPKSGSQSWWRKFLWRLRRMHRLRRFHSNRV